MMTNRLVGGVNVRFMTSTPETVRRFYEGTEGPNTIVFLVWDDSCLAEPSGKDGKQEMRLHIGDCKPGGYCSLDEEGDVFDPQPILDAIATLEANSNAELEVTAQDVLTSTITVTPTAGDPPADPYTLTINHPQESAGVHVNGGSIVGNALVLTTVNDEASPETPGAPISIDLSAFLSDPAPVQAIVGTGDVSVTDDGAGNFTIDYSDVDAVFAAGATTTLTGSGTAADPFIYDVQCMQQALVGLDGEALPKNSEVYVPADLGDAFGGTDLDDETKMIPIPVRSDNTPVIPAPLRCASRKMLQADIISIPDSTWTVAPVNDELDDPDALIVNGVFTAPCDGIYQLSWAAAVTFSTGEFGYAVQSRAVIQGTGTIFGSTVSKSAGSGNIGTVRSAMSAAAKMNAGQTFRLEINQKNENGAARDLHRETYMFANLTSLL